MPSAVEKLERRFAAWLGAADAVATGFGRSALVLAMRAVGVERGAVAVPEFICAQVPNAVRRAGGVPVSYPVGRDLTVRPEEFRAVVERGCRAAIVAHYFGQVLPQIETLAAICRDRGVPLIEDCALALGASLDGRLAGTYGQLAAFSFTKSDWCYGGGIVAARAAESADRLRRLREEELRSTRALALRYGSLRRLDYLANRPRWSRLAARAGRLVQRLTRIEVDNYYDAGGFDTRLPGFAARRAVRLLDALDQTTAQRHRIVAELRVQLRGAEHVLLRRAPSLGDTAAFVLFYSLAGRAGHWAEEAGRSDVTLRLCWPAYQASEAAPGSSSCDWLARHLLILEVHPRLTVREAARIANALGKLAARE